MDIAGLIRGFILSRFPDSDVYIVSGRKEIRLRKRYTFVVRQLRASAKPLGLGGAGVREEATVEIKIYTIRARNEKQEDVFRRIVGVYRVLQEALMSGILCDEDYGCYVVNYISNLREETGRLYGIVGASFTLSASRVGIVK